MDIIDIALLGILLFVFIPFGIIVWMQLIDWMQERREFIKKVREEYKDEH